MRSSNRYTLLVGILFLQVGLFAQEVEKGYYMCPVRPGEDNYLAGTMGELRSTHFHAGIDLKTSGISGLKVYAAADGYLSRVKVSPGGYGNALYVAHPNGTTTVYGHLREFSAPIAAYVRKEQYRRESFAVDISVPNETFQFKKGDVIALSGNSGSSSGPHLHFEIRDANQVVMNPLSYGFDEIKDNIPPILSQVAFVTMDENSRVNGMFGRFEYSVIEKEGKYMLDKAVTIKGRVGVEVYAYDRLNGANNRNGVVRQKLLLDMEPIFSQDIKKISFATSRNILVHANYKRMVEGGRRFNKYYVDDGNYLKFYETNNDRGFININDPLEHSIDIQLEDSYGNTSQYHLEINHKNYVLSTKNKNMYALNKRDYDVRQNILEIRNKSTGEECFARAYINGDEKLLPLAYRVDNHDYYLWDLNKGLPDSVDLCPRSLFFDFKKSIPYRTEQMFSSEGVSLTIPKYGLFDTLHLNYKRKLDTLKKSEYLQFDHYDQPLRKYASVVFTPQLTYDQEHSFVYSVNDKGALGFIGGEWVDNSISFRTRDLVRYTIATDTIPPQISHLKSKAKRLKFKLTDKMSGIGKFRADLNGKWVLMNYDAKYRLLRSDPELDIVGDFVLIVEDNSGNKSQWKRSIKQ